MYKGLRKRQYVSICLLSMVSLPALAITCEPERVIETTPSADFEINADGTATHLKTGLTWLQCSLGQIWDGSSCKGSASELNWAEALENAESFEFAGYTDWRLPNIKELNSIVEYACIGTAINQSIFPNAPSEIFWSSTPSLGSPDLSLAIDFYDGLIVVMRKKDSYLTYAMRLVRGE